MTIYPTAERHNGHLSHWPVIVWKIRCNWYKDPVNIILSLASAQPEPTADFL